MSDNAKLVVLRGLMVFLGVFSIAGVPIVISVWPAGWVWEPRQPDYEGMIGMIYLGFAFALLWAVRNPVRHIIIVWGFILSNFLHGGFMAFLALTQEDELTHLSGDVPFNLAMAVLLLIFIPWRLLRSEQPPG